MGDAGRQATDVGQINIPGWTWTCRYFLRSLFHGVEMINIGEDASRFESGYEQPLV